MKKFPAPDIAGDLLPACLFSFSLLGGAFHSLQYPFSTGRMALLVILFSLAWILMLRVPWAAFAMIGLLFIIVFFWEIPVIRDTERLYALLDDWSAFGRWALDSFPLDIPNPPQAYLDRALLLLSLGASLIAGLLVRVRTHPAVFLLLGGGLFFVQETYQQRLFFPAFFLFLVTLSLYTAQQTFAMRRRRASKAVWPLRFLYGAAPLCLLAAFLAALAPSPGQALGQPVLDWLGAWDGGAFIEGSPFNIGRFSYAGLKKLNPNEDLGGPLRQNNTLLLRIKAEKATYLRGYTYDTYTGRTWASGSGVEFPFTPLERDAMMVDEPEGFVFDFAIPRRFTLSYGNLAGGYQLLTGAVLHAASEANAGTGLISPALDKLFALERTFFQYDIRFTSSSGQNDPGADGFWAYRLAPKPGAAAYRKQEITFQNMRSNTLFLPAEAVDLTLAPPLATSPRITRSALGDTRMSEAQGRPFRYIVETCQLNLTRNEFGDLLRLSNRQAFTGGSAIPGIDGASGLQGMRSYAFWQASESERAASLQPTLPARVFDLARQLTADQPTDYDRALAIESYLRRTFTYDMDVPETPPGRDFVDYFLFDLQRGYCTYFASAMTVLCRAVGLPARYVEGFAPAPDPDERGWYIVTGEQAHAWCEVFFPGFGWIPFEPTASLGGDFERRYYNAEVSSFPPEDPTEPPPTSNGAATPTPPATPPSEEGASGGRALLGWLLAIVLLAAGPPALHAAWRRRLRQRARPSARATQTIFNRAVRLAQILGAQPPQPSETPLEWAARADAAPKAGPDAAFTALAACYCRLCFGPGAGAESDARALYVLYEKLARKGGASVSPFKYLLYRHYLGWL